MFTYTVINKYSCYRKLGLDTSPGIPNFGVTTTALGQELFFPPNVAGWEGGPSWINPATLLDRGNFARSLLFSGENRGAGFDEVAYMMMRMGNIQGVENKGYISGESDEDFDRRMNAIIETARQKRINRGGSPGAACFAPAPSSPRRASHVVENCVTARCLLPPPSSQRPNPSVPRHTRWLDRRAPELFAANRPREMAPSSARPPRTTTPSPGRLRILSLAMRRPRTPRGDSTLEPLTRP